MITNNEYFVFVDAPIIREEVRSDYRGHLCFHDYYSSFFSSVIEPFFLSFTSIIINTVLQSIINPAVIVIIILHACITVITVVLMILNYDNNE